MALTKVIHHASFWDYYGACELNTTCLEQGDKHVQISTFFFFLLQNGFFWEAEQNCKTVF